MDFVTVLKKRCVVTLGVLRAIKQMFTPLYFAILEFELVILNLYFLGSVGPLIDARNGWNKSVVNIQWPEHNIFEFTRTVACIASKTTTAEPCDKYCV